MEEKKKKKGSKAKVVVLIILSVFVVYFATLGISYSAAYKESTAEVEFKDTDEILDVVYRDFDKSVNDELYVKHIKVKDIAKYEYYIKNCVVLFAEEGTDYKKIENLAKENNAEICGYVKCLDFYEFEFSGEEMTYSQLEEKSVSLQENTLVEKCLVDEYCIGSYGESGGTPVDEEINLENSYNVIEGKKLQKYSEYSKEAKIAILDDYVYDNSYLNIVNEKTELDSGSENEVFNIGSHGTECAGVAAAKETPNGVMGICSGAEVYSYTGLGLYTTALRIAQFADMFEVKGIRVCNYSAGHSMAEIYDLESGTDENHLNYFNSLSAFTEEALERVIDDGFDFLIVQASGNYRSGTLMKSKTGVFEPGRKANLFTVLDIFNLGHIKYSSNAFYSSEFTTITNEKVKDHIIVVGEGEGLGVEDGKVVSCSIDSNSTCGERVDIIAPAGLDMYSLNPGDTVEQFWGTSAAAPVVSGTAALMYSIDESLTSKEVIEILLSTSSVTLKAEPTTFDKENSGYEYPLIDSSAAVQAVVDRNVK